MRIFKKLDKKIQISNLLNCLNSALREDSDYRKYWKTDVYGIAAQYANGVKKEDFEDIKNLTINEIVNIIMENK